MNRELSPRSRRDFLRTSVAASSALAALSIPRSVHAGTEVRVGVCTSE